MTGMELCYAAAILSEAVIAWLYLEYLFHRRTPLFLSVITFFIGYALLFAISLFHKPIANIGSFFVVTWGLCLLNYRCKLKIGLLHVTLLTFLMTLADVLSNLLIGIFGHAFAEFTQNLAAALPMAIISKLLYLLLTVLTVRLFRHHSPQFEASGRMFAVCVFPVVSVGIGMLICYLGMHAELTEATQIMIVVNMLFLLVMNLVFLVLYNHLQAVNADRTALQLSLHREEANAAYYQATQKQMESHRVLLHDVKNHLGAIQALAQEESSGKISAYISELEYHFFPTSELPRMSADPILNAVLVDTLQSCNAESICFEWDVRDGCTGTMDAVTITALYGNLLSNAVEAAGQSKEKKIEFSAIYKPEQKSIVISVVNSCDLPPIPDGKGFFRSTKNTSQFHGVGMKSIARVLEKYHGISTHYYDNVHKRFHYLIQIPF